MDLLVTFFVLIVLSIVALKWGVDSRDDLNAPEWERRLQWMLSREHARSILW